MKSLEATAIQKKPYGKLPDGREVFSYTLRNRNQLQLSVINYGGIITSLLVPDRNGVLEDVVLGFDSLDEYVQHNDPYLGAIIGRFGNRIANGKFELDGKTYQVATNNNGQHLHGGLKGFDKVYWDIEAIGDTGDSLQLTYLSNHLEEGYPGNLQVTVVYTLTDDDKLIIRYTATTDKTTVVNLTSHSYFNLTGNCKRDILDHQLKLNANSFIPVEETLIPSGEIRAVENTPFDFQSVHTIGERINHPEEQLRLAGGYDHTFVLSGKITEVAATVSEPVSGRVMEVYTTEPGVQLYTGNFLKGVKGKRNVPYEHRYGFCLETQHFPDSPNKPTFPNVVLNPGETFSSETVHHFFSR